MQVIRIDNFLGGNNYAVDPVYINNNQLADSRNVTISQSPINSPIDISSVSHIGLGGRGTPRRITPANAIFDMRISRIGEFGIATPTATTKSKTDYLIVTGETTSSIGVIGYKNIDQPTSGQGIPIPLFRGTVGSFSEYVLSVNQNYLLVSGYSSSSSINPISYVWDGNFVKYDNISIVAGATQVTGTSVQFLPTGPIKQLTVVAVPGIGEKVQLASIVFTFAATDVAQAGNTIDRGSTIYQCASNILTAFNTFVSVTMITAAMVSAGGNRINVQARSVSNFALLDATGGDLIVDLVTQGFQGIIEGNFVNFNGETSGGFGSTGWYQVTLVNNATDIRINPSHIGAVTNGCMAVAAFRVFDPLYKDADWKITAIGETQGQNLIATMNSFGQAILYVTSPGNILEVDPINSFIVGRSGERIQKIINNEDHAILIKERSAYAFYLNIVDPSLSSIFPLSEWTGIINNRAGTETPFGPVILTPRNGLILYSRDGRPTNLTLAGEILNDKNGKSTSLQRASLAYKDGKVYISIPDFGTASLAVLRYDLVNNILEKEEYISSTIGSIPVQATTQIHLIAGDNTFNRNLKLSYSSVNIVEFGFFNASSTIASQLLETAVDCQLSTRKFPVGDSIYRGILRHLILEYDSKDLNTITITPLIDGSSGADFTITPPSAGFNRTRLNAVGSILAGQYMQFRISFNQNITNNNRPTKVFRMWIMYDVEQRIQ